MNIKEAVEKGAEFLHLKGSPSPRVDAEILVAHVIGVRRIDLYLRWDQPMNEQETINSRELLVKRGQGQPVAYLVGERGFFKHDFLVGPGVLIPRPETELLLEKALELAPSAGVVHDWGCGSGCLGLSFIAEKPEYQLVAIDISDKAIDFTKSNADKIGVSDRVCLNKTSVDDFSFDEKVDVILANPPYIGSDDPELDKNVKAYEPEEALFSDQNGLGHHLRWMKLAAEHLKPEGLYLCETSDRQALQLRPHLDSEFSKVELHQDYAQLNRFFVCYKGD